MEHALIASQLLFYILAGLGIFFIGIGVLWFVSVYKSKNKNIQQKFSLGGTVINYQRFLLQLVEYSFSYRNKEISVSQYHPDSILKIRSLRDWLSEKLSKMTKNYIVEYLKRRQLETQNKIYNLTIDLLSETITIKD